MIEAVGGAQVQRPARSVFAARRSVGVGVRLGWCQRRRQPLVARHPPRADTLRGLQSMNVPNLHCRVRDETRQMKLDRGEYPEARPLGGESGRVSPPPHGRVRSVHARRPLLPLPRNVRRHLRGDAGAQGGEVQAPGAETTAGVRLVTSAGAIRLCGSIDGHHEVR